jgi:folate-dependent phosphoribosylglycinamide formyltransferase PurN
MIIACFISGSGTNYREIVAGDRNQDYIVFTNRPGCRGATIARENNHQLIELSYLPFLEGAARNCGPGNIPRNCSERVNYEQEVSRLIESRLGREPDLICLAGYDQWLSDWMVDKYYPRILNVHPGDTTRGYDGLHWIPSARAILAGDDVLRSTLFFVDKGEDTGPVLVQSAPLNIVETLVGLETAGVGGLVEGLSAVTGFARTHGITTYHDFKAKAGKRLLETLEHVCQNLQDALKVAGDWKIYPFAVHQLIARGRVEIDGRAIYIDGRKMPEHGYRLGEHS